MIKEMNQHKKELNVLIKEGMDPIYEIITDRIDGEGNPFNGAYRIYRVTDTHVFYLWVIDITQDFLPKVQAKPIKKLSDGTEYIALMDGASMNADNLVKTYLVGGGAVKMVEF